MHKLGAVCLLVGCLISQQPSLAWPHAKARAAAGAEPAPESSCYVEEGYYEPDLKAIREDGVRQPLAANSYGRFSASPGGSLHYQGDHYYDDSQLLTGKLVHKHMAAHKQHGQSGQNAMPDLAIKIRKGMAPSPGKDADAVYMPLANLNTQTSEAKIQAALTNFASDVVAKTPNAGLPSEQLSVQAPLPGLIKANSSPPQLSSKISVGQSRPALTAKLVSPPLAVQVPPPGSRSLSADFSMIAHAAPPIQYQPLASDLPKEETLAEAPAPGIRSVTPPKPLDSPLQIASAPVPVVVIPQASSAQTIDTALQCSENQAPPPGITQHFHEPKSLYQVNASSQDSVSEADPLSCVTVELGVPSIQPPSLLNEFSGVASWYGGKFLGRKTASGELFTAGGLTAASRYLPFGTKLFVHNKTSGKSVVVTVNDRGPFVGKRILDLSPAAAKRLDMVHSGLADVEVQVVKGGLMAANEAAP